MSNRNFVRAISIAMLVIAGSVFAYSQKPVKTETASSATFTGVANVQIFIENVSDGTSRKATTGADGKFTFGTLPQGKYKFVYRKVEGDPTKPVQGAGFSAAKSGIKSYDLQSAKAQITFEGGASPITRELDIKAAQSIEVVIDLPTARELKGVFKGQSK